MTATRDFAVAVFVVDQGRVLLLYHAKLAKWLPPGGHIEPNELPDEAAVREVWEEAGIRVRLVGEKALPISEPRQLVIPRGVAAGKDRSRITSTSILCTSLFLSMGPSSNPTRKRRRSAGLTLKRWQGSP